MKLGLTRLCAIVLIISAFVLSGCSGNNQPVQADSKGQGQDQSKGGKGAGGGGAKGGGGRGGAISVKTIPIERMSFQRAVNLSGTLLSQDQARVSVEVDGVVKDVLVELGQEVKAGDVIVQIEPRELQFALDRAESTLRQTEAQLSIDPSTPPNAPLPPDDQIAAVRTAMANRDDAKAQQARSLELSTKGLISKADLDTALTRVKVTEAQYQTALENARATKASLQDRRAQYELAKKKLADASVRAPVSGAISERLAQRGEYIRTNTQVATITQLSPLKIRSAVQEKYANLIRKDLPVKFSVESNPDETFTGRVAYISPAIDQTTRTFTVEVLVDNTSRKLRPGFFAQGTILTRKDDGVMAVPDDAVAMLAGVASVYVVDKGTVKQTNIQTGDRSGNFIEVVGGLKGDELLAASNLNQLSSGMRVSTGGGGDRRGDPSGEGVGADPEGSAPPPGTGGAGGRGGNGGRSGGRGGRGGDKRGAGQGGGNQ